MTVSSDFESPNPQLSFQEQESWNWQQIRLALKRRAWLFLLVTVGVTGGLWARTYFVEQETIYRSRFQLLVEPIQSNQEMQDLREELGSGGGSNSDFDYTTQINVLKSSKVINPIHEKLQQDYPNLTRQELVDNLNIHRVGESKLIEVSYDSSNAELTTAVTNLVADEYINYSEKQQKRAQEQVINFIDQKLPELQKKVANLEEELQAFRTKHDVIDPLKRGDNISEYLDEIKQRQEDTKIALEEKTSLQENLSNQLGLSLDEAMTTVALSQAPRYQDLLDALQKIEKEMALKLARYKEDSPMIERLKQQRRELLELLKEEAVRVLGEQGVDEGIHSEISSPNPVRLSLTQDLIETTNQIRTLKVRQSALEQAEQKVRNSLEETTKLASEYQDIKRRREVAQENINRLFQTREELMIEATQTATPWQVTEKPSSPEPVEEPHPVREMILGFLAGVLAGAGAVYLIEKIDNKYYSAEELKQSINLPLLGLIPFHRKLNQLLEQEVAHHALPARSLSQSLPGAEQSNGDHHNDMGVSYDDFSFLEAFRSFYTTLSFLRPDNPIRSLTMTSSIPGEGKSVTSFYFAKTAAAMGNRVLLVDADLRKPKIHQLLELPNDCGLSNVISTGIDLEEAIHPCASQDNLSILTSGILPPDPASLLASETMETLIQQWERSFDLIIFDTPPSATLADAKVLSPLTSGLILVTGLGVVDRMIMKDVIDTLKLLPTHLLGIVTNGATIQSATTYEKYNYKYYYRNEQSHSKLKALFSKNGKERS